MAKAAEFERQTVKGNQATLVPDLRDTVEPVRTKSRENT
jgi:hypothetical protein